MSGTSSSLLLLLLLLLLISSLLHRARRQELSQQRLKALQGDKRAHDWVDYIEKNVLDNRMTEAAKKACEYPLQEFSKYCSPERLLLQDSVDVDFKSWAQKRDLDETAGHAPKKKTPPLRFPKLPKGFKQVELFGDEGGVLEDNKGVPLVIKLTKVFDCIEGLEVSSSCRHQTK